VNLSCFKVTVTDRDFDDLKWFPRPFTVLPDSMTRRETLDWLRIDLEKLREIDDLVSISVSIDCR
jgi:hypothetical protein